MFWVLHEVLASERLSHHRDNFFPYFMDVESTLHKVTQLAIGIGFDKWSNTYLHCVSMWLCS